MGLSLKLYDDPAAGTLLYEDSNQVAVVDGLYSTYIGDGTVSGTLPGGYGNTATGNYSFAAGRRAKALHDGVFVWADDENADFTSETNRELAIRAGGGVRLSEDAGETKPVKIGQRFRDNGIIAWARVAGGGFLGEDYGVASAIYEGTGTYGIILDSEASGPSPGVKLIPMVTPEVDDAPGSTNTLRIASVNQITASNNYFRVYMNNGAGVLVDNDFLLMVTGR